MGSLRLTFCTGVLAAVAAVTPTASAADGGVSVSPSTPGPGSDLALRATGCTGTTGTAASKAFVSDAELTGGDGTLAGETRVRSMVGPGRYEVQVICGGDKSKSMKSHLTIGNASAAPSAPASPVAPVKAGGGGTAHLASVDTAATGPNTAHTVTGLVLAGAAAVAVVLRGTRRSRRTG
ncbi:hypothetical protein [Streptomyces sp. NPDC059862]|uniref:hypothetical protein n=1 Tax=unclassified Streptomyces TaxID=2593676 RepID=UPI00362A97E8